MRDWPPCPPIQRGGGRRSRPGANPFISVLTVARCPAIFPRVWPQLRDTLSTSRSVGRGTGLSYTCRRSLKPARFFVHSHSQKVSLFSYRSKRGAYRLFLLSSPPAVSVEQKPAWDWCGIFNFVKPRGAFVKGIYRLQVISFQRHVCTHARRFGVKSAVAV